MVGLRSGLETLKRLTQKYLKNKYWPEIRRIVIARDKRCQLCGRYDTLQVDHFISRGCSGTFFDIRNLTTLCSACHLKKTYGVQGFDVLLYDLVNKRESKRTIEVLKKRARHPHQITQEEIEKYIKKLQKRYP